jgi:hypothetical protein
VFGAPGGTRTHRTRILSPIPIPIRLQAHVLLLMSIIHSNRIIVNEFVSSVTIVINTIHPFIQDRSGLGTLLGIDPADTHVPVMRTRTSSLLLHQSFEETFIA